MLMGFMIAALGAVSAFNAPLKIENKVAPRVTIISGHESDAYTADEQAYLDGLKPYLDILIGEGRELQTMGNNRSRNIIELSLRMDRYRAAANNINQYVADIPMPSRLSEYVTEMQREIAASVKAIDASVDAFRHFDWDALGESVSAFSEAIDRIASLAGTPVAQ